MFSRLVPLILILTTIALFDFPVVDGSSSSPFADESWLPKAAKSKELATPFSEFAPVATVDEFQLTHVTPQDVTAANAAAAAAHSSSSAGGSSSSESASGSKSQGAEGKLQAPPPPFRFPPASSIKPPAVPTKKPLILKYYYSEQTKYSSFPTILLLRKMLKSFAGHNIQLSFHNMDVDPYSAQRLQIHRTGTLVAYGYTNKLEELERMEGPRPFHSREIYERFVANGLKLNEGLLDRFKNMHAIQNRRLSFPYNHAPKMLNPLTTFDPYEVIRAADYMQN